MNRSTAPIALLLTCVGAAFSASAKPDRGTLPETHSQIVRSPSALTAILEKRWPLPNIRTFCIPKRRHWNGCQNLVLGFHRPGCKRGEAWRGSLYQGIETGFDSIEWYGDACDGTAERYSLGVRRGHDFWLLEIQSIDRLNVPPVVAPPTHQLCFEGGDHSSFK